MGRGLKLMRSVYHHFGKHKVRCSSLCRTKYMKLMGTTSTFSRDHNFTFSACTIPMVVNRIEELFHSNNTIGMSHKVGRLGLGVVGTGRILRRGRGHRPAIGRVTRFLNISTRSIDRTVYTSRTAMSLAIRGSSKVGRVSLPAISRRSRVGGGVLVRCTMRGLGRGRGLVVGCECCSLLARDGATGTLGVARMRVSHTRGHVLTGVQRVVKGV